MVTENWTKSQATIQKFGVCQIFFMYLKEYLKYIYILVFQIIHRD